MQVNEIFCSLQGEGRYAGTPAVFVRFSGCNLRCWFCDTLHDASVKMSEEEIVTEVLRYNVKHIVLTGGEPSLQVTRHLTNLLHAHGLFVQMETNGTIPLRDGVEIDWITCSPKGDAMVRLQRVDEIKVVMESPDYDPSAYLQIQAKEYRLQPCDVKDGERNKDILKATVDYIIAHPGWALSLQIHKLLDIR